jgi:FAD/FMN-containing dehydrogenase
MEAGVKPLASVIRALEEAAGAGAVRTDEAALEAVAADLLEKGPLPAAVVRPSTPEEVAAAVAAATSHGFAVVPRGGGLSYTAGYRCPPGASVLFDLSGLDRIVAVSEDDLFAVVEAGVTWKRLYEALAPRGLRLPFFGTFSGAGATVGGGLSQGALFFGSARYGSAAELALGIEVATADGALLRTGQWAFPRASKPVFRNFGPDLTGLFLHDGGAFGIKTRAILRLMLTPAATGYASFAFSSLEAAASALSALAKTDACEDLYVLDPRSIASAVEQRGGLRGAASAAKAVAKEARHPIDAARALLDLARAGRSGGAENAYSLHCVAAGRSDAALASDLRLIRRIARGLGGRTIPAAIPRIARSAPFPDLNGVLGAGGARWAALNAKVAHSEGVPLIEAHQAAMAGYAPQMAEQGVKITYLLSALGTQTFSFEAVFHWKDRWLPTHQASVDPALLSAWGEPPENLPARALVEKLRERTLQLFRDIGAASNQIGRSYAYADAMDPKTLAAVRGIKATLDPQGLMNPGVLQL